MRPLLGLLLTSLLMLTACGSGGSSTSKPTKTPDPNATRTSTRPPGSRTPTGGSGGATRTPKPTVTPGGPTNTPRPTRTPGPPVTLFLRENGNDDNAGTAPDQALRTFEAALKKLSPGSTLYVGHGVYKERLTVTNIAGTTALPVQILADRTGSHVGDQGGDVVIDGDGNLVAVIVTGSPYVTIDGFILRGVAPTDTASAVSLRVRGGSDHVTISNCVIANALPADGIRVDSSSDVSLFNNLIFSADRGIIITGSADGTQLVNNTVALSARAALSLRSSGGVTPTGLTATNCIFQENGTGAAIDAAAAASGYTGDFNLVYQPGAEDQATAYNPDTLRGDHDLNVDAQFENINVGDVHLQPGSPAIDAGTGRVGDAQKAALLELTTTADGAKDRSPLDLGYHYPR